MGFSKWLMKKGIGSPGQTAKVWTEQYLSAPRTIQKDEILEGIVYAFQFGQQSVGNLLYESDPEKLVEQTEGCLACLIFFLLCDTKGFVKNIIVSNKNFHLASEAIYETVGSMAPNAIAFNLEGYKHKCNHYITLSRISYGI